MATSFELLQKHIFANDLWEVVQTLLKRKRLAEVLAYSSGDYTAQVLQYIIEAGDIDAIDDFLNTLQEQLPESKGEIMTIAERLREQGREQGMQQGRAAEAQAIARNMIDLGIEEDKITKATHLSLDEIEKLKQDS